MHLLSGGGARKLFDRLRRDIKGRRSTTKKKVQQLSDKADTIVESSLPTLAKEYALGGADLQVVNESALKVSTRRRFSITTCH